MRVALQKYMSLLVLSPALSYTDPLRLCTHTRSQYHTSHGLPLEPGQEGQPLVLPRRLNNVRRKLHAGEGGGRMLGVIQLVVRHDVGADQRTRSLGASVPVLLSRQHYPHVAANDLVCEDGACCLGRAH